jgi:hypothetical protein
MKRILVLLLVVVLPALAFADFQVGAVGMYKGTIEQIKAKDVGFDDFTFGAEARLKLGIFQAAVTGLYYPADADLSRPKSIVAATDVGLAFDLAFLRLGAGLGPNFLVPIGATSETARAGINLKGNVDVKIGNLSVGLVGFYYLDSFKDLANVGEVFKKLPWLGLTAMFKIF